MYVLGVVNFKRGARSEYTFGNSSLKLFLRLYLVWWILPLSRWSKACYTHFQVPVPWTGFESVLGWKDPSWKTVKRAAELKSYLSAEKVYSSRFSESTHYGEAAIEAYVRSWYHIMKSKIRESRKTLVCNRTCKTPDNKLAYHLFYTYRHTYELLAQFIHSLVLI